MVIIIYKYILYIYSIQYSTFIFLTAVKTTLMTMITFVPIFILPVAVKVGFGDYRYVALSGSVLALLGITVPVSYTTLGVLAYTDCLDTLEFIKRNYNGTVEWDWDAKYYLFITNCLLQYASIFLLFSVGLFFLHCALSVGLRHKGCRIEGPYGFSDLIEVYLLSYNENSKSVRSIYSENVQSYLENKILPVIYNSSEQDSETEQYLREKHRSQCRFHFPLFPIPFTFCSTRTCSWSETRIRLNDLGWQGRDTFIRMILQFGLLNKIDIHFFTAFHFKPSSCFLDYINISNNFFKYHEPIIEVLLLREDGFSLIKRLKEYAIQPPDRHALQIFLNKELLIDSPPPLWFFCLQKVRCMVRKGYSQYFWNSSENALMYKDFVLNPMECTHIQDIFKVIHLPYKEFWFSQQSKFGLLEDLTEIDIDNQESLVYLHQSTPVINNNKETTESYLLA